jgi:hypothetical protein
MAGSIVTTDRLLNMGLLGAGIVVGHMVGSSALSGQSADTRDLILIGLGLVGITFAGGGALRAFASGVGAAGVSNLIARHAITA